MQPFIGTALALDECSLLVYTHTTMNWVIVSWVFVALLTAVNVFVFMKLKSASEQMMKMAMPGAKNMNEAMAQMQSMMSGMGGGKGGMPANLQAMMGQMNNPNMQAQMKQAMDMLSQMQKKKK